MSSTFVLISLLLSLSMAVLVPEIKDSKKTIFSFSPEYDHMVNKPVSYTHLTLPTILRV